MNFTAAAPHATPGGERRERSERSDRPDSSPSPAAQEIRAGRKLVTLARSPPGVAGAIAGLARSPPASRRLAGPGTKISHAQPLPLGLRSPRRRGPYRPDRPLPAQHRPRDPRSPGPAAPPPLPTPRAPTFLGRRLPLPPAPGGALPEARPRIRRREHRVLPANGPGPARQARRRPRPGGGRPTRRPRRRLQVRQGQRLLHRLRPRRRRDPDLLPPQRRRSLLPPPGGPRGPRGRRRRGRARSNTGPTAGPTAAEKEEW